MARRTFSPHFLFFILFLGMAVLNLLVVVYPLVIEGMIIGSPPMSIIGLDAWAAHVLFGIPLSETFSAYGVYIPFLVGVYLLSFVPGFLIGLQLLLPTFRELVRNYQVIASGRRLAAKVLLDFIIVTLFGLFALTRILAYVMRYPGDLNGITPLSLITGYIITGFITGSCLSKSILALWICFECRKRDLKLVSFYVQRLDSSGKTHYHDLVEWALAPTGRKRE